MKFLLLLLPMFSYALELPVEKSSQLLVVHGQSNGPNAEVILFSKASGKWEQKNKLEAVIGKNGIAFGEGVSPKNIFSMKPKKQEGDGKSPAGVFALGRIFGKAPQLPFSSNIAYVQSRPVMEGVDDVKSQHYNQIVDTSTVKKDWKSFEAIVRKDNLYDWFLEIKHNPKNIPGDGSLIFMHVWRGKGKGTAGCTAMEEKDLLEVLKWLDREQQPLLILLPTEKLNELKASLGL